jgi:hypothetical protein
MGAFGMKPTEKQLKDPNWWDENSSKYSSHFCKLSEQFLNTDKPCTSCIPRPTEPQWTGPEDGLPPGGTECEALRAEEGAEWFQCKVNAYSDDIGKVWLTRYYINGLERDFVMNVEDMSFRPIRTQEEIERDELVKQAIKVAEEAGAECDVTFSEALYDTGMLRKPMSREEAVTAILQACTAMKIPIALDQAHTAAQSLGYKD